MATHSSTLAWKIQWMEEPGRLQSMGLHRVGHDLSDLAAAAAAAAAAEWRQRVLRKMAGRRVKFIDTLDLKPHVNHCFVLKQINLGHNKKIEYKIKMFVTKMGKKSLSEVLEEKKTLKEVL